ncbi:hypothetical protein niasHT_013890 [Heterodera trifolii]|uniref:BTB domain-containing protein n=1 Tax=Heterodera trifolii TaxID=157864 RepID=A0ABD2KTP3_9BILA
MPSSMDRMRHLLSTGEHSDVHFLVGDGDEKEVLPAHQFILKIASDVFEAMFRFDTKKERPENASANGPVVVEIPDIEPSAFKVMLSFIYTDDLSALNGDNAMAVLYAANKYNIPDLVLPSLQIPISELRNVFFAYAQALLFELEDFAIKCLRYICQNAAQLFGSDDFLQIDQKILCNLLESDHLLLSDEFEIWKIALRWADEKCRQNGIECSSGNRRSFLGSALFKIRFPNIHEDFAKCVVRPRASTLIISWRYYQKSGERQSKMANPSVQQLMDMVKQLLEAQQNAPPAGQQPSNVPSLPNVENFEFGEQSTDIEDWLQQFDFALDCAAPNLQDVLKVKLLMTKLSKEAFAEYKKSCMPKNVTDFDFAKTVEQLKSLFARPQSIWIDRYDCLRASKLEDEEFRAFVNRHKRLLRDFNFKKLKEEQFNCLMLLIAMKSPKDADLRKRILAKLAADGGLVRYDNMVEDLQVYLSTIAEAKALEQPVSSRNVYALKKKHKIRKNSDSSKGSSESSASQSSHGSQPKCWRCGKWHSPKRCSHGKSTCRKCNEIGHLERMCEKHKAWLKRNGEKKDGKAVNTFWLGGIFLPDSESRRKLIEIPLKMDGTEVDLGLLDTFWKSQEGNGQVAKVEKKFDSIADQSEKPKKHHSGKKPKFALGAKIIASLGLQPWRAGYVVNRQGTMYEIRFPDGTTGKFPEKGVKACALDSDEEIFDGLGLREEPFDSKTSKGLVGIDCDQRKRKDVIG